MNKRFPYVGIGLALVVLALAVTLFILTTYNRVYEGMGRVVGFGNDGGTVIIEHTDIPGLMPAMTMPFKALQVTDLAHLEPHDAVRFKLKIAEHKTWIFDVEVVPDDAVPASPAGRAAGRPATHDSTAVLTTGQALPSVPLIDQNGRPFDLINIRPSALLVTFIYTRCPLPEYCPRLSTQFRTLQDRIAERFPGHAHLVSISFDPSHDTPEVLRAYAARYTDSTDTWTFATGTSEQINRATRLFGVNALPNGDQIDHNLATALIDTAGMVVDIWRGNDWDADEVMAELEALLNPSPTASTSLTDD